MARLPLKAKTFLGLIVALGVACLAVGLLRVWPHPDASWFDPALFVLLAIFAGGKKIELTRRKLDDEASMMSLDSALIFAAMLQFGMAWALTVVITGTLVSCLYPKRQAPYQIAFNVAARVIEVFVTNLVFLALNGWSLKLTLPHSIVAVSLAVVTNFLLNTGMVATIIGFCTDQSPVDVWNEHFLITAPTYFYGAAAGAGAIYLFGSNVTIVLLALLPIAYFTYQSFAVAAQRDAEKRKYREDLNQSQQHLTELYLAT